MKTFISLDLEMNKDDVTGKVDKIIQIGAVAFTLEPFVILEELSVIINPNEIISSFITQLTGITQEMTYEGVDLQIGYGKLCELKLKYNCENYPVGWGDSDAKYLLNKIRAGENNSKFIFSEYRHFDVKTLYQSYRLANNLSPQAGLKKAMTNMGLTPIGPFHNATIDARETAKLFAYMVNLYKIKT